MKQFPNSQHPVTFISNTGCSVLLDSHVWEFKLHGK